MANQTTQAALQKPKLSLGGIINLSMGFMGIQMGFGLQNGNASRILSDFGADVHELSWFWIVAPLTGLIVQPIIGHMGDNTWGKMGRRKPYFLVGAILAALGLIFLPNSNIVAGEGMSVMEFMGISAILWIGIGFLALMDVSFNISMEPFRALVGDMLPKSQSTLGFSVQTILIGLGAILGSFFPWILFNWFGIANTAEAGSVAPNVIWSFYLGAAILIITILYTILTVKEYPPEDFAKYQGEPADDGFQKSKLSDIFVDAWNMPTRMKRLGLVQFFSWFALFTMWVFTTVAISQNVYDTEVNAAIYNLAKEKLQTYVETHNGKEAQDAQKLLASLEEVEPGDKGYFINSKAAAFLANGVVYPNEQLPQAIAQNTASADAQTLSKWQALPESEKYSDAELMAQLKDLPELSAEARASLEFKYINLQHGLGGDWTNVLFGTYNAIATAFAFLLSFIARKTSRKFTHIFSLVMGGLGLISMMFISEPEWLLLGMVGVGMAWASILSMPYALLIDSLPPAKMGVYMGIFNFFIVIPQIINALIGGPIVHAFFNDYATYYLAFGGVLFLLAALFTLRIKEPLFGEAEVMRLQELDAQRQS